MSRSAKNAKISTKQAEPPGPVKRTNSKRPKGSPGTQGRPGPQGRPGAQGRRGPRGPPKSGGSVDPVQPPKPPKPVKPAYADILRNANLLAVRKPTESTEPEEYETEYDDLVTRRPAYLTRRINDYDTWEHTYLKQLLDLRSVFIEGIVKLNPEMEQYLNSPHFFHRFNSFLYDNSSTEISEFVEPLTEDLENIYSEYMIKRNRI